MKWLKEQMGPGVVIETEEEAEEEEENTSLTRIEDNGNKSKFEHMNT